MKANNLIAIIITILFIGTPVMAISKTDALTAINKAESDISTMEQSNISTFAVNDTLKEARLQYDSGNYDDAAQTAAQVSALTKSAIHANELINQVENDVQYLESKGANATAIRSSLSMASDAFLREDFASSERYAQTAADAATEERSNVAIQQTIFNANRANITGFVSAYWKEITVVSVATAILAGLGWKRYRRMAAARRLAGLKRKKAAILTLMREAQQQHFMKGATSRREYLITMRNYRDQMADVNKRLEMLSKRRRKK
jgi:hypothetical protein